MVTFKTIQTMALVIVTNAPIATIPIACVAIDPPPKIPTANVPQIPATRCAEIAPTTSSIFNLSINGTAKTTSAPPTPPTIIAIVWFCRSGPAVIATSPPIAPLSASVTSTFLYMI